MSCLYLWHYVFFFKHEWWDVSLFLYGLASWGSCLLLIYFFFVFICFDFQEYKWSEGHTVNLNRYFKDSRSFKWLLSLVPPYTVTV